MPRVPMYQMIIDDIASKIHTGSLAVSSKLPSENDLAKRYGVSRMTVRQALDRLQSDGLLVRHQGAGNFVSAALPQGRMLNRLASFADEILDGSGAVTNRIVVQEAAEPPATIAARFGLADGVEMIHLVRVRLVGDQPAALQDAWVPFHVAPTLAREDLVGGSLYRTLTERHGVELRFADQVMTAETLDADGARLLDARPGDPVLAGERSTYSTENTLVEFTHSRTLPKFPLLLRVEG